MYLIIKKDDWGSSGLSFSVAGHDKDRSNAVRKLLAFDTLNENKKKTSYQLWSANNGFLDLDTSPTKTDEEKQEAGAHD